MLMMVGLEKIDVKNFDFNDALSIWYRNKKRRLV